jgi:hypothetical protein
MTFCHAIICFLRKASHRRDPALRLYLSVTTTASRGNIAGEMKSRRPPRPSRAFLSGVHGTHGQIVAEEARPPK